MAALFTYPQHADALAKLPGLCPLCSTHAEDMLDSLSPLEPEQTWKLCFSCAHETGQTHVTVSQTDFGGMVPFVPPPQERPPAYSLDDPRDVSDMAFLEEHEEQQEDPELLIEAAAAAGHAHDALSRALRLLNTTSTTADALVRADLQLIVARSAKEYAQVWLPEDEADYQLKKEVRQILSRF